MRPARRQEKENGVRGGYVVKGRGNEKGSEGYRLFRVVIFGLGGGRCSNGNSPFQYVPFFSHILGDNSRPALVGPTVRIILLVTGHSMHVNGQGEARSFAVAGSPLQDCDVVQRDFLIIQPLSVRVGFCVVAKVHRLYNPVLGLS